MFNIGAGEMVFILIAALLVLGPQRLPELARGIGKFLREFRRQTDEVRSVVVREFYQMDQEVQREPARVPPPSPVASTPELGSPAHTALPLPPDISAAIEAANQTANQAAHPPVEATPAEALAQTASAVGAPTDGTSEAPPEAEESVPRFDPIPGTVARNAPKQS